MEITYCDLDSGYGIDYYTERCERNLAMYDCLPYAEFASKLLKLILQNPKGENAVLMQKISSMTSVPLQEIIKIGFADELFNMSGRSLFGCTAVGKNGVIGQTLDLHNVSLALVRERENDALYMTMPPYPALFGMNRKIAFCTNHLAYPTKLLGGIGKTPISHVRRNILRCSTLDAAVTYLKDVQTATAANFLLSDGQEMVDIEVVPGNIKIHQPLKDNNGNIFFAHTNHELTHSDILKDNSCPRLYQATWDLYSTATSLETLLTQPAINLPMIEGFGTLVAVTMDVKNGVFKFQDRTMHAFHEEAL